MGTVLYNKTLEEIAAASVSSHIDDGMSPSGDRYKLLEIKSRIFIANLDSYDKAQRSTGGIRAISTDKPGYFSLASCHGVLFSL